MTGLQAAILGGSALILLVLALRLGLQRHLPRRLFPALWCAAAVRLLLPVSIPTRLSIWNLFERTSASAAAGTISSFFFFDRFVAFPISPNIEQTMTRQISPRKTIPTPSRMTMPIEASPSCGA